MGTYVSDMQEELKRLAKNAAGFQRDTPVFQYARWINEQIENKDEKYIKEYLPIIEREKKEASKRKPFLSIITRTQGKRPEMLGEMLLSLSGQSDDDFELLLIEHKLEQNEREQLHNLLVELPKEFSEKITAIAVNHGTRTTPLNVGFAHAHGDYVAVLDDDDIVFDDWVESFKQAAKARPGTIIHAYAMTQSWAAIPGARGLALRAEAAPRTECCVDYKQLRQMGYNLCPLNSLAFPSYYFQELGMIFDESLTTTEDWDYFMRLSFLAGVTDVRHPTCVYRLWNNAENSQTLHAKQEWEDNFNRIQQKFIEMPILFPAGTEKIVLAERAPVISRDREAIKKRWRKYVPKPIWWIAKKVYRLLGGKKWLG